MNACRAPTARPAYGPPSGAERKAAIIEARHETPPALDHSDVIDYPTIVRLWGSRDSLDNRLSSGGCDNTRCAALPLLHGSVEGLARL